MERVSSVGSHRKEGGTLLYVDLKGIPQVVWQNAGAVGRSNAIYGIPSPDGRYLAIRGGAFDSNFWLAEDF
jgi:hypothetical protein